MKAIIEMSKGTNEKTEIDKKTGKLYLDRKLDISIPTNYGFIKNTLASDGDALDVFVLGPTLSGLTELEVVPFGMFLCTDQGVEDHKLLAVPLYHQEPISDEEVQNISEYLKSYKEGFKVLCYVNNSLSILKVYRKTKIRTVYKHEKLTVKMFLGILIFSGLLIYINHFFH